MRCFQHFEREALGSCVGCGKGVCLDCLNKIQGRIHCAGCQPGSQGSHQGTSLQFSQTVSRVQMPQMMSSNQLSSTMVYSNKNRFFAALLAFCVGTFGVHKFYLGQPGWGFLYLLFFWSGLPSVAACIEGVLYLVRSDEDFVRRYGQTMFANQPGVPLVTSRVRTLPSTHKEYERFLLQFAQRHKGQISIALLMTEEDLRLDKVEDALARLTAKGVVYSEIDDDGYVHYHVPEFKRLEE